MTHPLFHIEPLEDPMAFLICRGIRFHLFARSAEGRRSGMDRKLASERAARARQRITRQDGSHKPSWAVFAGYAND